MLNRQIELKSSTEHLSKEHEATDDILMQFAEQADFQGLKKYIDQEDELSERIYRLQIMLKLCAANNRQMTCPLPQQFLFCKQIFAYSAELVNQCKVQNLDVDVPVLALAIYTLGKIAQSITERFTVTDEHKIDAQQITLLLEMIATNMPRNIDCSLSLFGAGLLALYQVVDGKVMARYVNSLLRRLVDSHCCDNQSRTNALYGVSLLFAEKNLDKEVPLSLLRDVWKKIDQEQLQDAQISQIAQAVCFLEVLDEFPDKVVDDILRVRTTQYSNTQIATLKFLADLADVEDGDKILGPEMIVGGWPVDVVVRVDDRAYAIELDGAQHYTASGSLCRKDEARDRWLKQNNINIVRIKNREFSLEMLRRCLMPVLSPSARLKLSANVAFFQPMRTLTIAMPTSTTPKKNNTTEDGWTVVKRK